MLDERLVLSLFALPTDEIKAALAELVIIRLHGVLLRRAQPRKLTRLLVIDEAWRVANSSHLESLAREGRAFGAGIAIGTQYPGDLPPDFSGALDTKIYLKNQQPDHKKAVVRALCGATSGPDAANLHGILERLKQFEGLIQNQQYLPYAHSSCCHISRGWIRQKLRSKVATSVAQEILFPKFQGFAENFNKSDFFVTKLTQISHPDKAKHLQMFVRVSS